ncbi:MAG: aminotransferase class V-fold PLP-dependent enzyme, partial [Nitrospinae bacterium]|nr:aminotransferase class V-fold PLP-dependent enzyme [Nitrospinota bacterium]
AVTMAARITGRKKVVISDLVHPHWRHVAATYTQDLGLRLETLSCAKQGATQTGALDADTAALVIQSPNALGVVEDMQALGEAARAAGALYVVGVAEPVALGLLAGPGKFGADIAVAEGRSFGGALCYGGPGAGMFATQSRHARQMPGRLAGKTTDTEGKPGYTLTLATREQHIRREKATSNICSNQALMATAAAIHISLLGKQGLRQLALHNLSACRYLAERVSALKGYRLLFDKPFFNEVAVATPVEPAVINRRLREAGIVGGLDLARWYPQLGRAMLWCATEVHSREAIDRLADILKEFAR